jgi:hypothetical protein
MKLSAISQRGSRKDFVDLFALGCLNLDAMRASFLSWTDPLRDFPEMVREPQR